MHIYMYVYIYIYVITHTHTYIYIYLHRYHNRDLVHFTGPLHPGAPQRRVWQRGAPQRGGARGAVGAGRGRGRTGGGGPRGVPWEVPWDFHGKTQEKPWVKTMGFQSFFLLVYHMLSKKWYQLDE